MNRRALFAKIGAVAAAVAVVPVVEMAQTVTSVQTGSLTVSGDAIVDANAYLVQQMPEMLSGQRAFGQAQGFRHGYDQGLQDGLNAKVEEWFDINSLATKHVASAGGKYAAWITA